MTPDRWRRIKDVVADALEKTGNERARYVQNQCADDPELLTRVNELLELEDQSEQFLCRPPEIADIDAPVPEGIGQFAIVRRIASGATSTVYEATQEQPNRRVALKLLQIEAGRSEAMFRFQRESELLAQLQHPHIAHVYESGVHEEAGFEVPFIAMELVDDARTIIDFANAEQLNIEERLRLFIKACRAVHHGHERGVVHRDLKPANILVGSQNEPKVIDFGIARVLDPTHTPGATIMTAAGDIVGTLAYMSPEQCGQGNVEVDARADVYALGMLLFQLISGRLPIEVSGKPLNQAIDLIRFQSPLRLSKAMDSAPQDLDAITSKALRKDPADRFASVAALAADIQRFLDKLPVQARTPSAAYHVGLFATRHRIPVAAGIASILILLIATLVSVVFAVQASKAALAETESRLHTERINSYLIRMLTSPSPHVEGKDVTVLEMLGIIVKELDEANEPPAVEAAVRMTVASTYLEMNKPQIAAGQAERAVSLLRDVEPDGELIQRGLSALGQAHRLRRDLTKAEATYAELVDRYRARPSPLIDLNRALGGYATVLVEQNKFKEAAPIAEEVRASLATSIGKDNALYLGACRRLAQIRMNQGDPDAAFELLEESRSIAASTYESDHPTHASILIELALTCARSGATEKSVDYARQSWDRTRDDRPVGSPDWRHVLGRYVELLVDAQQCEEAVEAMNHAITMLESTDTDVEPRIRAELQRHAELIRRLCE